MNKEHVLVSLNTKADIVAFIDYLDHCKESKAFSFASIKIPTENSSEAHLNAIFNIFTYMESLDIEHDIVGMYRDDNTAGDIYGDVLKHVNEIVKEYGYYDHNIIAYGIKLAILNNMAKSIDAKVILCGDTNYTDNKKYIDSFFNMNTDVETRCECLDANIDDFEAKLIKVVKNRKLINDIKVDLAETEAVNDYNFNKFYELFKSMIVFIVSFNIRFNIY